jgi:ABC-type multidrug transport system fused ATPase/permease subunit
VRPPTRSPARYLWWLVRSQGRRSAAGAALGTVWMVGLAVPPYLLSQAIDRGLVPRDAGALAIWALSLVGVEAVLAVLSGLRHRVMTKIRMDGGFRTVRAVIGQSVRLGATLPRTVSTGEVVAIGMSDVQQVALSLTVVGPGVGAVMTYVVVAAVLLSISLWLAVVVLAGVPLLVVAVGPLFGRLVAAGGGYRQRQGELTTRLTDTIGGLAVLNGLGGKGLYAERYRDTSAKVRAEGYRLGAVTSWVEAIGVGLPALFLAAVTWLGARLAASGQISTGNLVAVYGYVALLVLPVTQLVQSSADISRALVAARRITRFLALDPDRTGGELPAPRSPADLYDPDSGVRLAAGRLTALAAAARDAAPVVDRLAALADSAATWGGARVDQVRQDALRDRVLVADNEADIFAGPLREVVAGRLAAEDARVAAAIEAAAATDIALAHGLDTPVRARGGNLSGGQRQRVRLARALYADPEVLLAVEPTSAVDALTEAAMADGLRAARRGRTTLVTTTSPLLLDRADVVLFMVAGRVAAAGPHHDLLRTEPGYRALVYRGSVTGSTP